jgi:cathepsin B
MKAICIAVLVLGFIALGQSKHFLTQEFVDEINAGQSQWVATTDNQFSNMSEEEIKSMLQTRLPESREDMPFPRVSYKNLREFTDLPDNFDSRNQWKDCIHGILDQGRCGSCWAFGASEAHSDRLCIASGGKINTVLSSQDLVSCDKNNFACNGGYLDKTWDYIEEHGLVTEDCWPYSSQGGAVEKCRTQCTVASKEWKKYTGKNTRSFRDSDDAKTDIMTYGPLETGFLVYQDFMSYKSGIYKHKSGSLLGGHAIKVIGWGTEGKTKYWIAANSWKTSWGEKGFFRIEEGECQFDDNMIVSDPVF